MSLYSKKLSQGFTLVELVVTMGIVVTILTIILYNQSTYTDGSSLNALADEVSIAVTQAQVYGISVKELGVGTEDFTASYGIELRLPVPGSIDDAYINFADREVGGAKNKQYDSGWNCPLGGTSECLSKTLITRGNKVSDICVIRSSGGNMCNVERVDVSFARPQTEADLTFFNNGGHVFNPGNIIGAKIIFASPKNRTRSVLVYTTGQVSVQ